MKLHLGLSALLLSIGIYLAPASVQAQVIIAGPADTAAVDMEMAMPVPLSEIDTTSGFFLSKWNKPAKAALFSAIIPGAGQVYNRAYWKLPIIYATGGVLGYFLIDNHNKYQDYREALLIRTDGNPNTIDKYATSPAYYAESYPRGRENLRSSRDFYRRNRDLTILLSVLAYGLNIAEAYVHAHMKDFDVSENLSLNVQPNLVPVYAAPAYTTGLAPGLTLTLYTKSK